jgi:hypothetical protein
VINDRARREPINVGLVVEFDDGEIRFRFRDIDEDGQRVADLAWCKHPDWYLHWVDRWRQSLAERPIDWTSFKPRGQAESHALDPVVCERKLLRPRDQHFEHLYRRLVLPPDAPAEELAAPLAAR